MVLLPLLVVVVMVGIVYASRSRREHAVVAGGAARAVHHAEAISPVGWASVFVMLAAFVFWGVTQATLPIYYTAAIGVVVFLLAVVAVAAQHDRSPLLLIPLVVVPLAAALSIAFVLVQ